MHIVLFFSPAGALSRPRMTTVAAAILWAVFLSGCHPGADDARRRVDQAGARAMAFMDRLPLDSPDVSLRRIKDSALDRRQESWMYEAAMYRAEDHVSPAVFYRYADAADVFAAKNDDTLHAKVIMFRAIRQRQSGVFDTALVLLNQSLAIFERLGLPAQRCEVLREICATYYTRENFVAAADYAYQAWETQEKSPSVAWKARYDALFVLGNCYLQQRNYSRARDAMRQAVAEARAHSEPVQIIMALNTISAAYAGLEEADSAMSPARESYELTVKAGQPDFLPYAFFRLGAAYQLQKNYPAALENMKRSVFLLDSLKVVPYAVSVCARLGACYQAQGDLANAERWYLETLQRLRSVKKPQVAATVQDSLARLYFAESRDAEGLRYLQNARRLNDSMATTEKRQIVEDLNLKYETARREEKIQALDYARLSWRWKAVAALAGLLVALGAALFLASQFRQRRRVMEHREAIQRLELENAQQQLDTFKRNILSKNTLIQDLENRLTELALNPSDAPDAEAKQKIEIAKASLVNETDWRIYMASFDQVHKGFVNRLKTRFTDLSPAEIRLIMLVKERFGVGEAASTLGISYESVKKARYRLRKKLGLAEEDNLDSWIESV